METPEISIEEARRLLKGIAVVKTAADGSERPGLVGLRDRAILATLAYTACRTSAVSKLKRGGFYHAGDQWMLHFDEKGGKSREISARHDLEQMIAAYIEAAGLQNAPKDAPLFRAAHPRQKETGEPILSPMFTGAALGALACLVGTSVLELHCPNLHAWHILISHLDVAVLGGISGLMAGWALETAGRRSIAELSS